VRKNESLAARQNVLPRHLALVTALMAVLYLTWLLVETTSLSVEHYPGVTWDGREAVFQRRARWLLDNIQLWFLAPAVLWSIGCVAAVAGAIASGSSTGKAQFVRMVGVFGLCLFLYAYFGFQDVLQVALVLTYLSAPLLFGFVLFASLLAFRAEVPISERDAPGGSD
jgi:hypothetical protein